MVYEAAWWVFAGIEAGCLGGIGTTPKHPLQYFGGAGKVFQSLVVNSQCDECPGGWWITCCISDCDFDAGFFAGFERLFVGGSFSLEAFVVRRHKDVYLCLLKFPLVNGEGFDGGVGRVFWAKVDGGFSDMPSGCDHGVGFLGPSSMRKEPDVACRGRGFNQETGFGAGGGLLVVSQKIQLIRGRMASLSAISGRKVEMCFRCFAIGARECDGETEDSACIQGIRRENDSGFPLVIRCDVGLQKGGFGGNRQHFVVFFTLIVAFERVDGACAGNIGGNLAVALFSCELDAYGFSLADVLG